VEVALIAAALLILALLVGAPVLAVFVYAFGKGWDAYVRALASPDTLAAMRLTLLVAAIAVPLNTIFGLAAAWVLTRFAFRGRRLLLTLIDLPLSVSPVVSGLVFILLFGAQGLLGPTLADQGIRIVFAAPGIVLATVFVTFPIVARELIPAMEASGTDEELAAMTLGARGFAIFWRVTVPKVGRALFYGVVLCNARAMGEFGAVSVVSGHIRGVTTTLPLQVEILHNEYDSAGAFAVASLLALLGFVTLVAKRLSDAAAARRDAERQTKEPA